MLELLNIWKGLGAIAEAAIETLNASLPLAQTQHLPEILLNIRISKQQNLKFETVSNKNSIEDEEL